MRFILESPQRSGIPPVPLYIYDHIIANHVFFLHHLEHICVWGTVKHGLYPHPHTRLIVVNYLFTYVIMTKPREIMGFHKDEVVSLQRLKTRYRRLSKTLHPDKGGDTRSFSRLNRAYTKMKQALSTPPSMNHDQLKANRDTAPQEPEQRGRPQLFSKQNGELDLDNFNTVFEQLNPSETEANVRIQQSRRWTPRPASPNKVSVKNMCDFNQIFQKKYLTEKVDTKVLTTIPRGDTEELSHGFEMGRDPEQDNTAHTCGQATTLPYADYWLAYTKYNILSVPGDDLREATTIKQLSIDRSNLQMRPEMEAAMEVDRVQREHQSQQQYTRMEENALLIKNQHEALTNLLGFV